MTTSPDSGPRSHWILLRGLAREARHWGSFPSELQAAMSAHGLARVDCLDLPGTGRYSEMASPVTIEEITEFVRGKYLEIRQRQRENGETPASEAHLVAISLGGMVATHWIQRWPDDFRSCTLINTSFKGFSPIMRRLMPESLRHLLNCARTADAIERETHILKMVSNRPELYAEIASAWAEIHLGRPITYENFARQLLAAAIFQPNLRTPDVPVLVLNSLQDRMVHPTCSEEVARRWNAPFRRHPTAGHDLPLDDAAWVIEQIESFVQSGIATPRRAFSKE